MPINNIEEFRKEFAEFEKAVKNSGCLQDDRLKGKIKPIEKTKAERLFLNTPGEIVNPISDVIRTFNLFQEKNWDSRNAIASILVTHLFLLEE